MIQELIKLLQYFFLLKVAHHSFFNNEQPFYETHLDTFSIRDAQL